MDGSDTLGIYRVEEGDLPLVFGLLPGSFAEPFRFKRPIPFLPAVRGLDETVMPFSSGPLPLKTRVNTSTILPGFEDNDVLYGENPKRPNLLREKRKRCKGTIGSAQRILRQ